MLSNPTSGCQTPIVRVAHRVSGRFPDNPQLGSVDRLRHKNALGAARSRPSQNRLAGQLRLRSSIARLASPESGTAAPEPLVARSTVIVGRTAHSRRSGFSFIRCSV